MFIFLTVKIYVRMERIRTGVLKLFLFANLKFIFEEKLPKVNLEVKSGKEVSNNKAMDVYYVFKC